MTVVCHPLNGVSAGFADYRNPENHFGLARPHRSRIARSSVGRCVSRANGNAAVC